MTRETIGLICVVLALGCFCAALALFVNAAAPLGV